MDNGSAAEYRGAGVYVARILKAAKPSDLPIQAAIKCELADSLHLAGVGRAVSCETPPRDSDETDYIKAYIGLENIHASEIFSKIVMQHLDDDLEAAE